MAKADLTAEHLRKILQYDPNTGVFTNAIGRGTTPNRSGGVGHLNAKDGYRYIHVDRKNYMAHRLAWFYVYGEWPSRSLDHINGKRDDNSICNLRPAAHFENCQNRKKPSGYKNKLIGATAHKSGKWQASIGVNGRSLYLGLYESELLAHEAYIEAKKNIHNFNPVIRA